MSRIDLQKVINNKIKFGIFPLLTDLTCVPVPRRLAAPVRETLVMLGREHNVLQASGFEERRPPVWIEQLGLELVGKVLVVHARVVLVVESDYTRVGAVRAASVAAVRSPVGPAA